LLFFKFANLFVVFSFLDDEVALLPLGVVDSVVDSFLLVSLGSDDVCLFFG